MTVKAESFKSERYIKGGLGYCVNERWPYEPCPLHWPDYIEVELVLDGEGRHNLNGKEIELESGCLTVMRPTDFHSISIGRNFHLINLSINDRILPEEILSKLSVGDRLFFKLSPADTATIAGLLGLLNSEEHQSDQEEPQHGGQCHFDEFFHIKLFYNDYSCSRGKRQSFKVTKKNRISVNFITFALFAEV